jgi:hypothetical protein
MPEDKIWVKFMLLAPNHNNFLLGRTEKGWNLIS